MTVDPALIRSLAELLCAEAGDVQSVFPESTPAADILGEITPADLEPAVRAAAYRLAAREAARRG